MHRYIFEAVGTFFLVLVYGLTSDPFAIGLVLAALVYGGMFISGGHFNPAVTFAYLIKRDLSFSTFISYVISQLLGSFAAAGVLLMLVNHVFYVQAPNATEIHQQGSVEVILTFLIAFAYLSLIPFNSRKLIRLNALGVGLTLSAAIIIGKNISGSVFNPALSISTALVDLIAIRGKSFQFIPLFTLAPLVGAGLAGILYRYFDMD